MYVGVYTWVSSVNRILEELNSPVLHFFSSKRSINMVIKYVLNKIKKYIHLIPIHETLFNNVYINEPMEYNLDHYITLVCPIRSIQ